MPFYTQYPLLVAALLLLLAAGHPCRADGPLPLVYRLTAPALLQECDAKGNGTSDFQTAPGGAKFTIVNPEKTPGGYIIKFAEWGTPQGLPKDLRLGPRATDSAPLGASYTDTSDGRKKKLNDTTRMKYRTSYYFNLNYNAEKGETRYFLITAVQLAGSASPLQPRVAPLAGTMIMPFKLRPQYGGDFTKDVTLSGMGGAAFNLRQTNDLSLGLMLGLGLTSATLTKGNSTVTETQDRAALTFPVAVLLQWQQLQLGLVGGWDVLGEDNAGWKYNKKFWLAGGIGFNVFKADDATAKRPGGNEGTGTGQ